MKGCEQRIQCLAWCTTSPRWTCKVAAPGNSQCSPVHSLDATDLEIRSAASSNSSILGYFLKLFNHMTSEILNVSPLPNADIHASLARYSSPVTLFPFQVIFPCPPLCASHPLLSSLLPTLSLKAPLYPELPLFFQ